MATTMMRTTTTRFMETRLFQMKVLRRCNYQCHNMRLESLLSLCSRRHVHGGHLHHNRYKSMSLVATPPLSSPRTTDHHLSSFRRGYFKSSSSSSDSIANPSTNPFRVSNSLSSIATEQNNNSNEIRNETIPAVGKNKNGDNMMDIYAVAIITSSGDDGNMKLSLKNLSIQQIVKEVIPGMHPRDFFSLALTSLGDASRKRRALMKNQYYVKNSINPWFILPRESEIVVSVVLKSFRVLHFGKRPCISRCDRC